MAGALESKEPPLMWRAVCERGRAKGTEQPGIRLNKVTPFDF